MRRKTTNGAARDAAAQLHGGNYFFHAGNRRARNGFAVKLHFEAAILCIANLYGRGVLAGAAEEKLAKAIAFAGIVATGAAKDKRTCAVTEKAAKFAGNAAWSKRSAVDVSGDDGDGSSLSRSNQQLRNGQRIEQTEASASDVERAAIFAGQQSRMELR